MGTFDQLSVENFRQSIHDILTVYVHALHVHAQIEIMIQFLSYGFTYYTRSSVRTFVQSFVRPSVRKSVHSFVRPSSPTMRTSVHSSVVHTSAPSVRVSVQSSVPRSVYPVRMHVRPFICIAFSVHPSLHTSSS